MINSTVSASTPHTTQNSQRWAFSVVTSLFFLFGFITCLNDILVPHLKALFNLNYSQAALVQFTFFGAYFLVSLPAGYLVGKVGYQKGTAYGLLTAAIGCFLFYPATVTQSYEFFLLGLFVLASGITLIQVTVNPYVSILGPRESASKRLSLSQAFNSLGTTLAPLLGTYFILSSQIKSKTELSAMSAEQVLAYQSEQAHAVQGPYLLIATTLVALALIFAWIKLPKIEGEGTQTQESGIFNHFFGGILHHQHLVFGALAIFCYVGAEVAIGSYLINFLGLSDILGYSEVQAGSLLSLYWGGAMVGRFIGAAILEKVKPSRLLAINALCAALLVLVSLLSSGIVAAGALLLVGLFNSIMFPTIFSLAIDGLGAKTPQGSGLLCMAIVGGAFMPLAQGLLADRSSLQLSFCIPMVCYIFVFMYGAKWYQNKTA